MTRILFVHGMGRSPLSAWPMLRRLRHKGLRTRTFGYMVSIERFDAIRDRLATTIASVPDDEPLLLIGHSLGGVLIRAALARLDGQAPRLSKAPQRVFLLASPQSASRMARRLQQNLVFRALTGECGQLLASPVAMANIAAITSPVTSIVGIKALPFNRRFGAEINDGVVTLSEVRAPWLSDEVQLDLIHSVLPASSQVADVVLARLEQDSASSGR
jgi:alpha-beta hydrolase superfamily lysophospholipase